MHGSDRRATRTRTAIRLSAGLITAASVCLSCSEPAPPQFPDHLRAYLTEPSNPGFALYQEASGLAERHASELVKRVSWTPDKRKAAIEECATALERIAEAQRQDVAFVFTPHSPLAPPGERRGWRFLGRVLVWQIEGALKDRRHSDAVATFLTAARFGADLSGGDAMDANIGYTIIAEAADPLWRAFPDLPPEELRRLFRGIQEILLEMPSLETTLRHERATMLKAVQTIQDAFLDGDLQPFEESLGRDIGRAVRYLSRLKQEPREEQVRYFERFAAEADQEASTLLKAAPLSPHLWTDHPEPAGERPWKRFAAHYFRTGRHLMEWWAGNQARLRLMAVDAALFARLAEGREPPGDLSGLPRLMRTDPFSGRDFIYMRRDGAYRLYSYGRDRKDDDGEGGPTGTEPDLVPWR